MEFLPKLMTFWGGLSPSRFSPGKAARRADEVPFCPYQQSTALPVNAFFEKV